MKIVGCDLHARQQSIAMVDTDTGEFTSSPGKRFSMKGMRYESFTRPWRVPW